MKYGNPGSCIFSNLREVSHKYALLLSTTEVEEYICVEAFRRLVIILYYLMRLDVLVLGRLHHLPTNCLLLLLAMILSVLEHDLIFPPSMIHSALERDLVLPPVMILGALEDELLLPPLSNALGNVLFLVFF